MKNITLDDVVKVKNSIDIKTSKLESVIDKIKAVILIQIKIIMKYENLITIVLSQIWGNEERKRRKGMYLK